MPDKPTAIPAATTTATTTALGFDYGTRKIGVAYGQALTGTTRPLNNLPARDGIPDWNMLGKLILEWQPQLLVVGLPLNMDGSESELSVRARKFANRLHGRFGLEVHLVDERLSTREARETTTDGADIDSVAAAIILRDWFNQQAARPAL